jgi:hypothetical protein
MTARRWGFAPVRHCRLFEPAGNSVTRCTP